MIDNLLEPDVSDDDASVLSFITGFVLGITIGLLVAVILAPVAGRDAREQAFQAGLELLPSRKSNGDA